MALAEAGKHAVWFRRLLNGFGIPGMSKPVILRGDNKGSLALGQDPVFHKRTKHIDIRYRFIRELVDQKKIQLLHVGTDEMAADCLTKSLGRDRLARCMGEMGMRRL
jgi:hypothetical protein